jgi:hypothetical protein
MTSVEVGVDSGRNGVEGRGKEEEEKEGRGKEEVEKEGRKWSTRRR